MKVLVTGANGFLGKHVVGEFLRRGHTVRAMVRPTTDVSKLGWDNRVELARADLRVARDLAKHFDGIDALVHLAAAVTGDADAQFAAGVVGTEKLLAAMAQSNTKRLVLASSFSVYDWSAIRGELNEASPIEKDVYERDGYAVAKIWQERIVRRAAEQHNWQLTVLRPGFIWGRGNEYLAGIGQSVGPVHIVFGGFTRLPITHVENCADCFVAATENPAAIGETFNVVDDIGARAWTYMGEYLRRSGKRGFRLVIPYWMGMNFARLAQRTSKLIFHGNGKLPSLFVPCRFEARFKPLKYTNAKLQNVLGWKPPLSLAQCLDRTYGSVLRPEPGASAEVSPRPASEVAG